MKNIEYNDDVYDERLAEVAPNLRDELAMQYDGGDPWGSVLGFAFAVNDLASVTGNDTDDTYSPGLHVMESSVDDLIDEEDYPISYIAEMYRDGVVTDAEINAAVPVLSDWLDYLEGVGGLDY